MSENNSHKQILKSTGLVGGSQIIIIIIGIARTKVLAVLLGPVGVGLAGLYQSIISLVSMATNFGISFSAVRDIAQAASTNDTTKISSRITVLRRWLLFTGLLGALTALVLCVPISIYTFGDSSYAKPVAFLAISIFLGTISSGQLALLQGLRQLGSMAKANIIGAFIGLLIAVPVFWYWGHEGIVPSILLASFTSLVLSWHFSRRIKTVPVSLSLKETFHEGKQMVQLGFFTVITGFVDIGTMYLVRAYIANHAGIDGVGQFTAGWSISSMYISAIFTAMAADYFPRLSGVQSDAIKLKKMVNEQTEIAMLIAAPIIIMMIAFIKIVVHVFYSSKFGDTATILSWQLAGDFFKVLTWPMGFIFLVKGKGRQYVFTNIAWDVLYLLFVYIGWQFKGIEATGFAFALAYLVVLILSYALLKSLVGFSWSAQTLSYIYLFLPLLGIACASTLLFSGLLQYSIAIVVSILAVGFSFLQMKKFFNLSQILARFRKR
jgi:O-antigen/teichoic acid export membrane protein